MYRAQYSEGIMIPAKAGTSADPKPTAGKVGTQITVSLYEGDETDSRRRIYFTTVLRD
jgi:hypothetical protein